jgi:putative ABC transport system substrate-binding protein
VKIILPIPPKMKIISLFLGVLCAFGFAGLVFSKTQNAESAAKPKKYVVPITQIVAHPSLEQVILGVKDYVEAQGLKDQVVFELHNANGNMVTVAQIAGKILSQKPDAILAIGTPSAQSVLNRNRDIPVLFSPISDPVGAKLVKSWEKPMTIATGTSDKLPIQGQIDLIKEMLPNVKRVGFLYNSSEANSVAIKKDFFEACLAKGLVPVEGVVTSSADILQVATGMTVDAFYVPTDNTVVGSIEVVIKASLAKKVPLFTGEAESVAKGALASLATDYYELGKLTGKMLVDVLLQKAKPESTPVQVLTNHTLVVNMKNALAMGVSSVPETVKKRAKIIQ